MIFVMQIPQIDKTGNRFGGGRVCFQYGEDATEYLKSKDRRLAEIIDQIGHINRPVDTDLFSSVVHHIIGQQISTKAQQTIWRRMNDTFGAVTPETVGHADVETLQGLGMTFRKAVWEILLAIPSGQTMTYGEIAQQIAAQKGQSGMSAQAVGGAVGHNAISLIIPCHRMVGTDGSLTGYAGGIQKKMQLLKLEQVDLSNLFVPRKGTAL